MVDDTARRPSDVVPPRVSEGIPWEELSENESMKADGLKQLRELIAEEASLNCPTNEDFLIKFLRARKYNVGKAMKNIRKYFEARRDSPEVFEDRTPFSALFDVLCREHQVVTVSRKTDAKGRGAAMFRLGAWNPSICSLDDFLRMSLIQAERMLLREENQLRGVVIIMDFKGLSAHHLKYYSPSFIKKVVSLIQCRLFGCDLSQLHGVVPDDLIPEAYGGTFESFNYDELEKDQQTAAAFFNDMNRHGYSAAEQKVDG